MKLNISGLGLSKEKMTRKTIRFPNCDAFHKPIHKVYTNMVTQKCLLYRIECKMPLNQTDYQVMLEKPQEQSGFTLIELLVTITIAGILIGLAIPSFTDTIRSNRLTTITNDFVSALNLARSEAVKRGKDVSIRKLDTNSYTKLGSSVQWDSGWDVFVDEDGDGKYETGDTLLRTYSALNAGYTLRPNSPFGSFIRFKSSGESNNSGRFVICDNSDGNLLPEANTSKLIMIVNTGRARLAQDINDPPDGIPNSTTAANSNITACDP
jgi:type IV fimbrial biogenesis protein FimT